MDRSRKNEQSILVSGGSRGLGLHLLEGFLQAGNKVASFARSETSEVQRLRTQYPERFYFEPLDTLDQEGVKAFVKTVDTRFGRIDALVNNAAVGQDELLVHTSSARIAEILSINVTAPILLTRLVARRMLLQGDGGRILNITSICASRGYPGLAVYAASKGALDAFTRSMARELGEAGITFNSIAPGFFASEMSSVLLPQQMEAIRNRTPTGRLTNEDHVLAVAELLLSRDTNINGQTIVVDGGISV
jgi:3-oxoacyl-[acyl-carrier protein] reductase